MTPTPAGPTPLERYLPWRRWVEVGFWVALTLVNTFANSVTVLMDIRRTGLGFAAWEPVVWEVSSSILWLAIVWPLAAFTRRFPLHWGSWRRQIGHHVLASLVVSLTHVLGMVALRHGAYNALGDRYDFGNWGAALFYEYLKDARTYLGMVVTFETYRLVLRRAQGEARELDAPEGRSAAPEAEDVATEEPERPKRFLVRKLNREFLVATDDIDWLQAEGNYVKLRVNGHDYLLRSTLAGILARLDPARFVRIHRSYLLNLDRLASIEPLDSGDARVHLRDGSVLPCSRNYRGELRER